MVAEGPSAALFYDDIEDDWGMNDVDAGVLRVSGTYLNFGQAVEALDRRSGIIPPSQM